MLKFSTKARTLEQLSKSLRSASVLPLLRVAVGDFEKDEAGVLDALQKKFTQRRLIVRSSASQEDGRGRSLAGHYLSVANVERADRKKLAAALRKVIASYGKARQGSEVLVQPMLEKISMAGVIFTVDLTTAAPYYCINYDESGSNDAVTAGNSRVSRHYVHFRRSPVPLAHPGLARLVQTCGEIEKLFGCTALDIEFAFAGDDRQLYILQVRPLGATDSVQIDEPALEHCLKKIDKKIRHLSLPHPNLLGGRTLFGVMPDWNPAEMIGIKPRPLTLSLYKELITDNIWAYQRDNYGYRNLRSHPLLISFMGVPYIDLRVDFNSFVPKTLSDQIGQKLVNYYLDKLAALPSLHDKVEFEIVYSCYFLNLPEKLQDLLKAGFNQNEIRRIEFALLNLTNNIINPSNGLYKRDLDKMSTLAQRYEYTVSSDMPAIDKLYWLIEDCKRYGTLPFAGIARAAFIAVQFLKSCIDAGVISKADYDAFMNSLNTVAKQMNQALNGVNRGSVSREDFLRRYGHLRPGTYDILSPRYDEKFDFYFARDPARKKPIRNVEFHFSPKQISKIDRVLGENGMAVGAQGLLSFVKEAVEGREFAKFVFTRSVSKVLSMISELGRRYGISDDQLSYLDIRTICSLYSNLDHLDLEQIMREDIRRNSRLYDYTSALKLPSLIIRPEDIYGFFVEEEKPSFVTRRRVTAKIVEERQIGNVDVSDKIVFVKSADPGYDFLFSRRIAGLVTQFGGANSHMTIRCAELSVPGVIGAGEKNFSEWLKAKVLEIDCSNGKVRVVA